MKTYQKTTQKSTIGERLAKLRKHYDISLGDVARVTKIKISDLKAIEANQRQISPDELFKLAKIYQASLEDICCIARYEQIY